MANHELSADFWSEIRKKVTEAPALPHIDIAKPIMVFTDASDLAMATILLQP